MLSFFLAHPALLKLRANTYLRISGGVVFFNIPNRLARFLLYPGGKKSQPYYSRWHLSVKVLSPHIIPTKREKKH